MSIQISPGFAVWMTGLPSSGKTTLARTLEGLLSDHRIKVQILDSDDLRHALTPDPSFSKQERDWFYHVLVYIAGLLTDNGVNVLIAATGPRSEYRQAARKRMHRFAEVYLYCPKQVCKERDPKGLWEKAESGEINNLPGLGAPYQAPSNPEVTVYTDRLSPRDAAGHILQKLKDIGFI
jgi:adenylylsulfate kinase